MQINLKNSITYIENMRVKDSTYGIYKISKDCIPTLLSSCFSALGRELIGDLSSLTSIETQSWVAFIQNHQNPLNGFFVEPELMLQGLSTHSSEYIIHQATYFSLHALDALGTDIKYRIKFVDQFWTKGQILSWLEKLDWSKPWLVSNEIMFLFTFLIYDYERFGNNLSLETVFDGLDWLDAKQDSTTGFWGTDEGASLFDSMAGAYHILLFYYYLKRPINYPKKIIDNTLILQKTDGLFSAFGGGGSCEDLDAIDILVNLRLHTNYKSNEIMTSLEKAKNALAETQNEDGGFRWVNRRSINLNYWVDILNPKPILPMPRFKMIKTGIRRTLKPIKETIKYSGWDQMEFPIYSSDLWSTWFRLLALAEIDCVKNNNSSNINKWNFRKLCGLGWSIYGNH